MEVVRIENTYRRANSYIIDSGSESVLLVDLGGPSVDLLADWLHKKSKKVGALLLTHEHADHCIGLLQRDLIGGFKIYCSQYCGANISNPKRNFSEYSSAIPILDSDLSFYTVHDRQTLDITGVEVMALSTPGHSPGCTSFAIGRHLFTGDSLIPGIPIVTQLPGGNKETSKISKAKIEDEINPNTLICPGHGPIVSGKSYFSGAYSLDWV